MVPCSARLPLSAPTCKDTGTPHANVRRCCPRCAESVESSSAGYVEPSVPSDAGDSPRSSIHDSVDSDKLTVLASANSEKAAVAQIMSKVLMTTEVPVDDDQQAIFQTAPRMRAPERGKCYSMLKTSMDRSLQHAVSGGLCITTPPFLQVTFQLQSPSIGQPFVNDLRLAVFFASQHGRVLPSRSWHTTMACSIPGARYLQSRASPEHAALVLSARPYYPVQWYTAEIA